ncbi:MAG: polysaccharide pyruvyl transferase family protein, partial [Candidatus Bathyarchaeota archaeon]
AQTDHFICKKIKDLFNDENEVEIISNELNVFEIEKIISQFNFIIASRYHSIVNAFKNGIPVLAIGWAAKYFELMRDFNQLDYIFDTQKNFEKSKVLDGLSKLLERYSEEKKMIKSKLDQMKKNKIFNVLE